MSGKRKCVYYSFRFYCILILYTQRHYLHRRLPKKINTTANNNVISYLLRSHLNTNQPQKRTAPTLISLLASNYFEVLNLLRVLQLYAMNKFNLIFFLSVLLLFRKKKQSRTTTAIVALIWTSIDLKITRKSRNKNRACISWFIARKNLGDFLKKCEMVP